MQRKSRPPGSSSSRRRSGPPSGSLSQPAHPDRFSLLDPIGQGGAGRIYRARDELVGRFVAIKLPASDTAQAASQEARRLQRETRCLGRVPHPNVVALCDAHFGEADTAPPFLVLDFVPGPSLDEFIHFYGSVPPVIGMMVGLVIARVLYVAHQVGVIHRDVKPANILVDDRKPGRLLLCDFGAAWLAGDVRLTAQGELVGTPAFMSPEQTLGEEPTGATDIFSLGVTLHELVTGELPFAGKTPQEMMASIREQPYQAPTTSRHGRVPQYLMDLLESCMRKDPASRPSAKEVVELLDGALRLDRLEDIEHHLAAYLANPDSYSEELDLHVKSQAMLLASVAYQGEEWDVATERCGRVLEVAPKHARAQGMLRLIEARLQGKVRVTGEFELEEARHLADAEDEDDGWEDEEGEALADEEGDEGEGEVMEGKGADGGEEKREAEAAAPEMETNEAAAKEPARAEEVDAEVVPAAQAELALLPEASREEGPTKPPVQARRQRRWAMGVALGMGAVVAATMGWVVWTAQRGVEVQVVTTGGQESAEGQGSEVRRRIEGMKTKDEVQMYVVQQLRTNRSETFRQMMKVLDAEHGDPQEEGIEAALYVARDATYELMLQHVSEHPRQTSAQVAAYALGRIARSDLGEGITPDARITPLLLTAIAARLPEGTASIWRPMRALEAVARLGPVPEASPLMAQVLDQAQREGDKANSIVVQWAASVLVTNGGELAGRELRVKTGHYPEVDPVRRGIEEALLRHKERLTAND